MSDITNWKILHSEYLAKKNWLTVRKDQIMLPQGNIIPEYYVLEYPDIANVIAITIDHKFIIVEQYRHGIGQITQELCGGTCNSDENPLHTIQRELLEETGYGNGTWTKNAVYAVHPIANNNYTHCFVAENVELISHQHLEQNENIKVKLYSLSQIKQKLANGDFINPTQACSLYKYIIEHHLA